jgi:hypothetical protein
MNLKEITKELSAKTLCYLLRSYDELGAFWGQVSSATRITRTPDGATMARRRGFTSDT